MSRTLKALISVFFVILFAFAAFLNFCPIFNKFPVPTGNYAVGLVVYDCVDEKRADERQSSGKRELAIEIFYPSAIDEHKDKLFAYQEDKLKAIRQYRSRNSYLPNFVWDCLLKNIYSYSEPNAPISSKQSKYPVVIFLPGIGAENLYNVYLEDLASHGYIVVAISPTFDTSVTVFANKQVYELDPVLKKAAQSNSREQIYDFRTKAHYRWIKDVEFVLDKLKALENDPKSIFYKKLDLLNIGFMGHSHGGAVVTDFCANNSACKVGINIDGWTKTVNTTKPFAKPFLFLLNKEGLDAAEELAKNMGQYAQKVRVKAQEHAGFSDLVLIRQPWAWFFGGSKKIGFEATKNAITETTGYIQSFFDKHLKNNISSH